MPNRIIIKQQSYEKHSGQREYVTPTLREVPLTVEYQFLASQLDDYGDNPIYSDPSPWEDEF
jgi:hypothetical protein